MLLLFDELPVNQLNRKELVQLSGVVPIALYVGDNQFLETAAVQVGPASCARI